MALENATYIDELDSGYPKVDDALSHADDHIRLLKSVILSSLPNISGPVTATEIELNVLDGILSTLSVNDLNLLAGAVATGGLVAADITALSGSTGNIDSRLSALELGGGGGGAATLPDTVIWHNRLNLGAGADFVVCWSNFQNGTLQPHLGFTLQLWDANFANKRVYFSVLQGVTEKYNPDPGTGYFVTDNYGNCTVSMPQGTITATPTGLTGTMSISLTGTDATPYSASIAVKFK